MARGRKNKKGRGPTLETRGSNGLVERSSDGLVVQKNSCYKDDNRSNAPKLTSFSLQDEARNTERHNTWTPNPKLRNARISFVSARSVESEAFNIPQTKRQQSENQPAPRLSPPLSSVENVTLEERVARCLDTLPSELRPGTDTQVVDSTQHDSKAGHSEPCGTDVMFFFDDVKSPVAARKRLVLPKLRHPGSPSPSTSSEEVIVFRGRSRGLQSDLQSLSSVTKGSPTDTLGHQRPLRTNRELTEVTEHDKHSLSTTSTVSQSAQRFLLPEHKKPESIFSHIEYQSRLSLKQSDVAKKSRGGKRIRGRSKKEAVLAVEDEEDLLADYIEHMCQDENPSNAYGSLSTDGNLLAKFPIDTDSHNQTESADEEIGIESHFARQSGGVSKAIRSIEEEGDLDASIEEGSDDSIDAVQIVADLLEYKDDMEDERDLLERKHARMTDEHIARLLAKQQELGIESSELLIFDGNDTGDQDHSSDEDETDVLFRSAASRRSRKEKERHQDYASDSFPSANDLADMFDQASYGGFDVMDHDPLSPKNASRSRRDAPIFDLSDVELEASLRLQYQKDRSKKAIRKKEREQMRAQGLLRSKEHPDLKVKYREGISFGEIKHELVEFMFSARQSLALPPMSNFERRSLHEVAHAVGLKSKSMGKGNARFPVLFKPGHTGDFDEITMTKLDSIFNSNRFFPRNDIKGRKKLGGAKQVRRNGGRMANGVSYTDGEVVGAAAPEIGQDNRGRAMLEKMGWSKGTALGALNNKGMLQPVIHTVKISKAGLG